jgi:lysophospholipase L1-like esterase
MVTVFQKMNGMAVFDFISCGIFKMMVMRHIQILIAALAVLFLVQCKSDNKKYILALGDSNGAHANGWVFQLQQLRPADTLLNYCISGNTIGFNNNGRDTLNTLSNLKEYLDKATRSTPRLDMIIVLLGTNDCKAVFDSLQDDVKDNLDTLICRIEEYPYPGKKPEIVLITPPPTSPDSLLIEKYLGITNRLANLVPEYTKVAEKYHCQFIDIYHPLSDGFDSLNEDGIHLNEVGYEKMAKMINDQLSK